MVGGVCAGHAALACAFGTERTALCRLKIDYTSNKRQLALSFTINEKTRLTNKSLIAFREANTGLA
jgi:hypothetical protein